VYKCVPQVVAGLGAPPAEARLSTWNAPQEATMRRTALLVTMGVGFAMIALPLGWAGANHVKIEGSTQAPTQVYQAPAPAPTLHADHIKAQRISANTIYANKIEADNVQGQIHQSKDVKVGDTKGKIEAPDVMASVIYADEISANSIVAQNVYVRDLRRP